MESPLNTNKVVTHKVHFVDWLLTIKNIQLDFLMNDLFVRSGLANILYRHTVFKKEMYDVIG